MVTQNMLCKIGFVTSLNQIKWSLLAYLFLSYHLNQYHDVQGVDLYCQSLSDWNCTAKKWMDMYCVHCTVISRSTLRLDLPFSFLPLSYILVLQYIEILQNIINYKIQQICCTHLLLSLLYLEFYSQIKVSWYGSKPNPEQN